MYASQKNLSIYSAETRTGEYIRQLSPSVIVINAKSRQHDFSLKKKKNERSCLNIRSLKIAIDSRCPKKISTIDYRRVAAI